MLEWGSVLSYALSFAALYMTVLYLIIYLESADDLDDPPPPRALPGIDVIVPAFNEEKHIGGTIQSLLALDYPARMLRVVVIDDGSTDGTLAAAKRFEGRRVLVLHQKNGGKASALNRALKKCGSELVAVLDADSVVARDALRHMVGYFTDPCVAAVTPMMKVREPKTPLQALQYGEYVVNSFGKTLLGQLDAITVTPGPFSVYRRSVFGELGGFDEKTITEDQEIALRIQAANYRIASSRGAVVYTDAPSGLASLYRQRLRWYRGSLGNVWKHRALFSPRYGDLGLFVLPSSLLLTALGLVSLAYSAYSLLASAPSFGRIAFPLALQASDVVLAATALLSFSLAAIASRSLGERNPVGVFLAASLIFPLLSLFWLAVIFSAAKDSLSGVHPAWNASR